MKTSNAISPMSLSAAIAPVSSASKPTNKPSEKPQEISLDEWHQRALSGLNDQAAPLPKVW